MGVICEQTPAAAAHPDAAAVVRETALRYANARSYHFRGVTSLESGGTRIENYRDQAAAPGGRTRLFVRSESKELGFVTDGATQWAWLPRANQYVVITDAELASSGGHWAYGTPPGVRAQLSVMLETSFERLGGRASGASIAGKETLNTAGKRVECFQVDLGPGLQPGRGIDAPPGYTGPSARRVWIGVRDGLVWKDVERKPLELGSSRIVTITTTWELMSVGEQLPDDLFRFVAPKGMDLVRTLDLPPPPTLIKPGARAPGFELPLVGSPGSLMLSQLRGKVVLIDFWTTWCPPCQFELPALEGIYRDWHARGLEIVGISDEEAGIVARYRAEHGHTFPTVVDVQRHAYNAYQVYALPTVVLIDRSGTIVSVLVGGRHEDELRRAILAAGL